MKILFAALALAMLAGCSSALDPVPSAEYPTHERWWK